MGTDPHRGQADQGEGAVGMNNDKAKEKTPMNETKKKPGRLLTMTEVAELVGMHPNTLYSKMAEGAFPQPIRLPAGLKGGNGTSRGWKESEVEAWIRNTLQNGERVKYGRRNKAKEGKQ